jgi:hypothetical protein
MFADIAVSAVVGLATGIAGREIGRRYEQKAVAKVLSEFAIVDRDARELVNHCYSRLSSGIRAELDRLLKR